MAKLAAPTIYGVVSDSVKSGSHSSHEGNHQFHLPSSLMLAGTSNDLISVASRKIAIDMPKPICSNITRLPAANPMNTATMMSDAPVMSRPVELRPNATAAVLSPVRLKCSRIRRVGRVIPVNEPVFRHDFSRRR